MVGEVSTSFGGKEALEEVSPSNVGLCIVKDGNGRSRWGGGRERGPTRKVDGLEDGLLDWGRSAKLVAVGHYHAGKIDTELDGARVVASQDMVKGLP